MTAINLKIGDKITKLGPVNLVGIVTKIVYIKGKTIRVFYTPIKRQRKFQNEIIEQGEEHGVNYNINTPLQNILYK